MGQTDDLSPHATPPPPLPPHPLLQAWNANVAVISLEVLGSFLFILGSRHGARLLMLALLGITPIMHDFYKLEPGTADWNSEFVNFLKVRLYIYSRHAWRLYVTTLYFKRGVKG